MSGLRGVDPTVSIVADDRQLRLSVGLRGGLEVMGLPATVFGTASKLLAENPASDHVIVVGDADAAQFASSEGKLPASSSDRKDARLFSSHAYPQSRSDYPAYWRGAGKILAEALEANIESIEIAVGDDGIYRLRNASDPSDSATLASFDSADTAREYIKSLLEMCGPLVHDEQSQPGQGVFLFQAHGRRYEASVETRRDGEIFTGVRVGLRPLGIWSHPAPRAALPSMDHDWDASDLTEETSDATPIIRMVHTIHAQALHEGAHRIILQPHERGVKLDYAIGDYDFEIMTLPLHVRDAVVQRLRIMADLWLANRHVVQHGKYLVRFEGIDYEFDVMFVPGPHGDRVEMTRHDLQEQGMKSGLSADGSPSRLPLDGKLVLLLGNESIDTTLREQWTALGCRRLIATTVPVDTASALLFTLTFYRALMRHGDERAAFKKAKTAVFSGEEIKMFE